MKELKPCPFCGGNPKMEKYYESADGRNDELPKIICKCGVRMLLTYSEFSELEKKWEYKGGYLSSNKGLWYGMHFDLIDKWNRRVNE